MADFAYYLILGKPLVFYLGILTYLSFLSTALLGYFFSIGKPLLPFKWHPRIAILALTLGLIHGLLAVSIYF